MVGTTALSRRSLLSSGARLLLLLAAALLRPRAATAATAAATRASAAGPALLREEDLPPAARKVIAARFGDRPIRVGHVQLDVPESAPDGRTVPLFIESDLPMAPGDYVKTFHLLVDHNPDVYLAGFHLTAAMGEAAIDTRIKMRRSSHVRVIAETSRGDLWTAASMVYVTMNGCV